MQCLLTWTPFARTISASMSASPRRSTTPRSTRPWLSASTSATISNLNDSSAFYSKRKNSSRMTGSLVRWRRSLITWRKVMMSHVMFGPRTHPQPKTLKNKRSHQPNRWRVNRRIRIMLMASHCNRSYKPLQQQLVKIVTTNSISSDPL